MTPAKLNKAAHRSAHLIPRYDEADYYNLIVIIGIFNVPQFAVVSRLHDNTAKIKI